MCTDVVSRTSAAGIVDTNLGRSVAALVANVQSGSRSGEHPGHAKAIPSRNQATAIAET
jgi:hypothetical protein